MKKKIGFAKRNFWYKTRRSIHETAMQDSKFRKFWDKEKMRRVIHQKICKYCGRLFQGDRGAVLHHVKMQALEKEAKKKVFDIKREMEISGMSFLEAQEKIIEIEKELIDYYKALKDTDLICIKCHAREHSEGGVRKNFLQTKLFY